MLLVEWMAGCRCSCCVDDWCLESAATAAAMFGDHATRKSRYWMFGS